MLLHKQSTRDEITGPYSHNKNKNTTNTTLKNYTGKLEENMSMFHFGN